MEATLVNHLVTPKAILASEFEHYKFVEVQGKGFRFWRLDSGPSHRMMVAEDEVAVSAGLICVEPGGKVRMADTYSSSLRVACSGDGWARLEAVLGTKVIDRWSD